ncbi:hypothetical protein BC830DRAFT_393613 [Chytriomyces sp. MP71]|nr:hypothetical protein BC830DRAFT_393613 [Chytriomyces sp. MP71]
MKTTWIFLTACVNSSAQAETCNQDWTPHLPYFGGSNVSFNGVNFYNRQDTLQNFLSYFLILATSDGMQTQDRIPSKTVTAGLQFQYASEIVSQTPMMQRTPYSFPTLQNQNDHLLPVHTAIGNARDKPCSSVLTELEMCFYG